MDDEDDDFDPLAERRKRVRANVAAVRRAMMPTARKKQANWRKIMSPAVLP
jgi:hypothetical protein